MNSLTVQQIADILEHQIIYKHSKSHGHGGQNINKRETKAEGYFTISDCSYLDDEMKDRMITTYHNHINHDGVLRMTCQEQRKYHQNMKILKKHFRLLLGLIGDQNLFEKLHHHRKKGHRHAKR